LVWSWEKRMRVCSLFTGERDLVAHLACWAKRSIHWGGDLRIVAASTPERALGAFGLEVGF
jgi:hypothetical protein